MEKLKNNIINIYGDVGKNWLNNLSFILDTLSIKWNLSNLIPVTNMSYNYVTKAVMFPNKPVVLKISCDKKSILNELQALKDFDGVGTIEIIDYDIKYHALLLQQAIPGQVLKSIYPEQTIFVIDCYVDVINKLHSKSLLKTYQYRHIKDWLAAIDNCKSKQVPKFLLEKAISLKNKLLESLTQQKLLHGDLHLENILQNGSEWVAIDPKGIIGEPEFEVAAFDFILNKELNDALNIKNIFEERTGMLAHKSNLNLSRIKEWIFVRLILFAVWAIQDHSDPNWAINLANTLSEYLG